jgi:phytoene synthase
VQIYSGLKRGVVEEGFASASDYAECRRLHRRFGTTYYFASRRFPSDVKRRTDALYGFVRVPDEWVDNPGSLSEDQVAEKLRGFRAEFLRGIEGVRPDHPVLRAFCDAVREAKIPVDEPLRFLDAMEQDLTVSSYATYEELRHYMRGSAVTVGLMMCHVLEVDVSPEIERAATALGEAMQLTNFIRDVREDARRSRIYLPQEDLASFGVSSLDIFSSNATDAFRNLIRFEIARARALYSESDEGIGRLPMENRRAVRLARVLYSRILDRIEAQGCDVFTKRARTSWMEKLIAGVGELARRN